MHIYTYHSTIREYTFWMLILVTRPSRKKDCLVLLVLLFREVQIRGGAEYEDDDEEEKNLMSEEETVAEVDSTES